jgi:pimeloyl-ACP methyl ester carboxylesterase
VISYYDDFLTTLHHELPSTAILGTALPGHEDYELERPLSLQEQVVSKVSVVDAITSSPPFSFSTQEKPRLILMGHSVGAYIAFEVLKQRPQTVHHIFLLFPTLSHIGRGSLFARTAGLFTMIPFSARLVALIVSILRFMLPLPLLALILRFLYPLAGTALAIALSKTFTPSSAESFVHLAKHEFRGIRGLDIQALSKYAKRISAYYAVRDSWVPRFAREEIIQVLNDHGGDAVICDEGFPHAFSLGTSLKARVLTSVVHGPQMARKISPWIASFSYSTTWSPRQHSPQLVDWSLLDQDAETVTANSPEGDRKNTVGIRKTSIGDGVEERARLIRDLE